MNTKINVTHTYNRYRQPVITITATITTHPVIDGAPVEKEEEITIELKPGRPSYDRIVDAIVSRLYPNPKMQATINNYLLDPTNPITLSEFNVMQEVRAQAKAIAIYTLQNLSE